MRSPPDAPPPRPKSRRATNRVGTREESTGQILPFRAPDDIDSSRLSDRPLIEIARRIASEGSFDSIEAEASDAEDLAVVGRGLLVATVAALGNEPVEEVQGTLVISCGVTLQRVGEWLRAAEAS